MVHGHQDAVWGQSTGSVRMWWVTEHSRLWGARTCPQAPSHAHHCGSASAMALGTAEEQRPQTTSAWEEKASGVPQAPCLHSCRCEDRLGGAGTLHSKRRSQRQRKLLLASGGDRGSRPEQKHLHSPTEQSSSDLANPPATCPLAEEDKRHTTLPQKLDRKRK